MVELKFDLGFRVIGEYLSQFDSILRVRLSQIDAQYRIKLSQIDAQYRVKLTLNIESN